MKLKRLGIRGSICPSLALCWAASASGETLSAIDDRFAVPRGAPLEVAAPGVLDNDTRAGKPAAESAGLAHLLRAPDQGVLDYPTDPGLSLCLDGSFRYTPDTGFISTTPGAAYSGRWGVYDPRHGAATGVAAQCDIDNPPLSCRFHDGVTGTRAAGAAPLHGIGGYFRGMDGANIALMLDDWNTIELGSLTGAGQQFLGVLDRAGFRKFSVIEQEGKVGQALTIFADDIVLGVMRGPDLIGVRRGNRFYLDSDAGYRWNTGDTLAAFGLTSDIPVAGDWDGDGLDEIGVWRSASRSFYLDLNGSNRWDHGDIEIGFGIAGDRPVIGDWNGDGIDDIGVWRPAAVRFFLDANANRAWDVEDAIVPFGTPTDTPLSGDWNGDGVDEIGVWRAHTREFVLDDNGNLIRDAGDRVIRFGTTADRPVTGDWNADGRDEIGVWRPATARFMLDANANLRWDAGDMTVPFGLATDTPVTGRW